MEDIIIIGAGISGAATARELARYDLKVKVLEKDNDAASGTTKANSAIVHSGYDAKEGTLMAKYNAAGNKMFDDLARELDIPFKRCGSLVLAFSDEEVKHLETLLERGRINNIPDIDILTKAELLEIEPNLNPKVVKGLLAKTAGIVGPWELTIGMLENAKTNGVEILLNHEVLDIQKTSNGYKLITNQGEFETRVIVNASGVYADKIHNLVSKPSYRITPRRGQYFVMDKNQGKLTSRVIFQCPTKLGKGVLVTPTVHGNLLLGPDAEDLDERDDLSTTKEQLEFVKVHAVKSITNISFRDSIRTFAGLRAQADCGDFVIGEASDAPNFFDLGGIKSPGLTAAPAFGKDLAETIAKKLDATLKNDFNPIRKQIIFMEATPLEKQELIKKDSRYGRIVCRCENITEGEIVQAIHSPLGATTVDGIKKRCRPGMGRCQGGFCGPRVQEILAEELGVPLEDIMLDGNDSYILTGKTKSEN